MKYITTEVQRRIMFIPVLNLCNFFLAVLNCRKTSKPTVMGVSVGICAFCIVLPISLLSGILSTLFPQFENIFFLITIYIGPVCMSHGLIKLQEKHFL